MSAKFLYYRLFNKISEDIIRLLLDNTEHNTILEVQYNGFKSLREQNERHVIDLLKNFLTDEHKNKINEKNDTLFTSSFVGESSTDFSWVVVFNEIQKCWQSLTNDTKRVFWNSLQQLISMGDKC